MIRELFYRQNCVKWSPKSLIDKIAYFYIRAIHRAPLWNIYSHEDHHDHDLHSWERCRFSEYRQKWEIIFDNK